MLMVVAAVDDGEARVFFLCRFCSSGFIVRRVNDAFRCFVAVKESGIWPKW